MQLLKHSFTIGPALAFAFLTHAAVADAATGQNVQSNLTYADMVAAHTESGIEGDIGVSSYVRPTLTDRPAVFRAAFKNVDPQFIVPNLYRQH